MRWTSAQRGWRRTKRSSEPGTKASTKRPAAEWRKCPYLCECGEKSCLARVELTPAEYEAVRAQPARFFVVPGHEDLTAGEVVVGNYERFRVVEKQGEARELVERGTPQVS